MSAYPFQLLQDNYKLAGLAKNKLNHCISPTNSHQKRIEYNLREVVGHANLLDNILSNIDMIKFNYLKEQEYKLHQRSNEFYKNSSYGNDIVKRSYHDPYCFEDDEGEDEDEEDNNLWKDSFDIEDRLQNDINNDSDEEDLFTLSDNTTQNDNTSITPIPIIESGGMKRGGAGSGNTYNDNYNYNYTYSTDSFGSTNYVKNGVTTTTTTVGTTTTSPQDITTMYYRNHI